LVGCYINYYFKNSLTMQHGLLEDAQETMSLIVNER
jgi:hypothetical protein